MLFIDSSYVPRIGGDISYVFGQVVPLLPAGALVHVHDIFTPYDYPAGAHRYFWTEQYVVEALLSHCPRYEIELATHFLSHRRPKVPQEASSPTVGKDLFHYGTSLWLSVR